MAGEPIKLGSAAVSRYVFETGSTVTISGSGIQACSIKALWGDSTTVLNNIPPAGTPYNAVFGNSFLPSDFKLDLSDNGSAEIEYLQGKTARVTFSFKRPDPNAIGQRKVSVDSAYRFVPTLPIALFLGTEAPQDMQSLGLPGIPEPVVTVTYNAPTIPALATSLYAAPGSAKAAGFPAANPIVIRNTWTGTNQTTGNTITATYDIIFVPATNGWQQTSLKAQPVSGETFFDVAETWRMFYIFGGVKTVAITGLSTANGITVNGQTALGASKPVWATAPFPAQTAPFPP